jgi:predicted molibdopterin-dependent oxidoreductase YjgC
MGAALKRAITQHGTKLIVSDPRKIDVVRFADVWLRAQPGTDVIWINALVHVILRDGLHDQEYIDERTEEFTAYSQSLAPFTPEHAEKMCGIPVAELEKAAHLYAKGRAAILYCMGITQHVSGTDNVKALANLAMLCGNIGIKGGGLNPLRGQNNVQGACDMGALPVTYPAYGKVTDDAVRARFEAAWGVKLSPSNGMTSRQMFDAVDTGSLKAMYLIGENPVVSHADSAHAVHCLEKIPFLVVQDIFLTETAQLADVVLPAACFAEKDGTFSNTERRVQRVRKAVNPPQGARDDAQIMCNIAAKMGATLAPEDGKNIAAVFDEMASVTPSYAGITYERIEESGIQWPCPDAESEGTEILHVGKFVRGKGKFHPVSFVAPAEVVDEKYPLILTTGRVLYQYHTGTMTRKAEGLAAKVPTAYIEMSSNDAAKFGVTDGKFVKVSSRRGFIEVEVQLSEKAVDGTVFIPFHFAEAAANVLTNSAECPESGIAEVKVCAVTIEPVGD